MKPPAQTGCNRPVKRVAGSCRVDDPGAVRGEPPEASSLEGEPAAGPASHDRLPPRRPGQRAERLARTRIAARRDELLRHDRVIHVGKQAIHSRGHAVEIGDDPRSHLLGASHRAQRLSREVSIDQQHLAPVDLGKVEGGGPRLETASVRHHEAPLTGLPVDQHHGNRGAQARRVHETSRPHASSAQLRADEAPIGIVSQARKDVGFTTQGCDLAERVAHHAPGGDPSLPIAQPRGVVRRPVDDMTVIDDAKSQAHDA